jgi:hypothetical protein
VIYVLACGSGLEQATVDVQELLEKEYHKNATGSFTG